MGSTRTESARLERARMLGRVCGLREMRYTRAQMADELGMSEAQVGVLVRASTRAVARHQRVRAEMEALAAGREEAVSGTPRRRTEAPGCLADDGDP